MRPSVLRAVVAWICLFGTVLNGSLLRAGFVSCRDASGASRVEWGCDRDAHGGCARAPDSVDGATAACDAHDDESVPCDDRPVTMDQIAANGAGQVVVPAAPAIDVAWLDLSAFSLEVPRPAQPRRDCGRFRPPDEVARVRATVLRL